MPTWTESPDPVAVRALAAACTEADGVAPLSEQTLLALGGGRHLVEVSGGELLAYATPGADGTAELAVAPSARRRGLGARMLRSLAPQAIWAHGDLPAAAALAVSAGFERGRVLYELARSLPGALPARGVRAASTSSGTPDADALQRATTAAAPDWQRQHHPGELTARPEPAVLPPVVWPQGVTVRTFEIGRDEATWLALNASAFAHHPEQGRWTAADLAAREAEPWFDPAGFFLAERDGRVVGFHWTKVSGGLGEVYVVGVDPASAGGGLGRALTLHGLHHLADAGLPEVRLYVDGDNPRAVALYRHLGFADHHVDVTYVRR